MLAAAHDALSILAKSGHLLMFVMFLASDEGGGPLFVFPSTLPWKTVDIKSVLSLQIACPTYFSLLYEY